MDAHIVSCIPRIIRNRSVTEIERWSTVIQLLLYSLWCEHIHIYSHWSIHTLIGFRSMYICTLIDFSFALAFCRSIQPTTINIYSIVQQQSNSSIDFVHEPAICDGDDGIGQSFSTTSAMWWATGVRLLQSVEQRCTDGLQGIILEVWQLPVIVTYCFEEWVRIAVI